MYSSDVFDFIDIRSIYVHRYNTNSPSQVALLETINRTAAPTTSIFCGNNTSTISPSIHATCTHLNELDYTLRHMPAINEMILDMDGSLQQQDWRWTTAFLDTQANTVHILLAMDNHNYNYIGWVERLEQIVKDRGEYFTVVDHRDSESKIDGKRMLTQVDALPSWQDIQSGDCIVMKSRHMMVNMKDRLEHDYGFKCFFLFPQLPEGKKKKKTSNASFSKVKSLTFVDAFFFVVIQSQQINAFNSIDSTPKVLLMADMTATPSKM
jgi:hypothetical protein